MTDITERLRAVCETGCDPDLPYEAADEIDRLREQWADAEARNVTLATVQRERDELRARVAELEAADGICFTAMLVEIDGHAYGLRPGAARVVREALLDARRYKWLRDTPGVSWDELTDGGVSMWVGDASAIRAPSLDAAIDAAMAKDGAPVVLDL